MENYIGLSKCNGELVIQKLDANGLIKGFDMFYPVLVVSGRTILEHSSSGSTELTLENGLVVKSGMTAMPVIELPDDLKDAYMGYTVTCAVCSEFHDSDDDHGPDQSWTIINECEAVCLGCRTSDMVMTLVESPDDVFKSKNLEGVSLKGYKEIDELFCDSSGFGSENERALTKEGIKRRMKEIISKYGEVYTGITGIGQFQVYITVFKKVKAKAKKPAKSKKTNKKTKRKAA